jgi:aminopeptidase
MREIVSQVPARDVDLAAKVVVETALRVRPRDKLVVLSDDASRRVGRALVHACEAHDGWTTFVDLDQHGPRPHRALSDYLVSEIESAQCSVFVAQARHQELGMRQHLLYLVQRHRLRHAHMPGISRLAFARGMRLDYTRVRSLGVHVLDRLRGARCLEAHSPEGTELRILIKEGAKWFPQLGEIEPGRWGNLPAGAIFATPELIEGRLVANASLGAYFGEREGLLRERPVSFTIEDNRVTDVAARDPALRTEIEQMLGFSTNSDRVGVIALGVNAGLLSPTGEAMVDQNLPGLHVGIGDPAAQATGATWSARTSFAVCQADATVLVDGAVLVSRGKLLTPA